MPPTKQRSGAKRVRGSARNADKFRIGKVQGYLRGNVWYLYYHEQGQRRRPCVSPDLEVARQMAAQINSQLETGAPAALSFEAISIVDLRNSHNFKNVLYQCVYNSTDIVRDEKTGLYKLKK